MRFAAIVCASRGRGQAAEMCDALKQLKHWRLEDAGGVMGEIGSPRMGMLRFALERYE